jgi:phosphoglycolate phosphatase
MPKRGTIIFDLDGTLVDSAPDLADALDSLLVERGHAPLGLDHTRRLIGHGMAELVRKGLQVRGETLDTASLASAVTGFLGHYTPNLSRRSFPYPHTVETLTKLASDGLRLVVCTNKLEASACKLLSDHGLLRFFSRVAGPDTFGVAKPDPAHLLRCLPHGGPAIMVGDSEPDILAAKAAHLPVIGVAWGYAQRPLADIGPDAIALSMQEIPALVAQLILRKPAAIRSAQ